MTGTQALRTAALLFALAACQALGDDGRAEPAGPQDPSPAGQPEEPEESGKQDVAEPAPPPELGLLPGGKGFTGPTAAPAAAGEGPGSDAKAIARWDVVPFQTFTEPFAIGVVAFHIAGIDRVEFSANGGAWTAVGDLAPNPRTGVWEYSIVLDPAQFADGPVEVRAIAYPERGVPRLLAGPITDRASVVGGEHSMFLFANAKGGLTNPVRWVDASAGDDMAGDGSEQRPFATPAHALEDIQKDAGGRRAGPACDGATILLRGGAYSWGPASKFPGRAVNRWAILRRAPGVPKGAVIFDRAGRGGFRVGLVKLEGVVCRGEWTFGASGGGGQSLWVDGCSLQGPGRGSRTSPFRSGAWAGIYVTDTSLHGYRDGAMRVGIARGVTSGDLGSDAFSNTSLVLNCSVDGIDGSGTKNHPDVYQFYGRDTVGNVIVYGLKATNCASQGIFAADLKFMRDVAFVNVVVARPFTATLRDPPFCQWNVPVDHLVMRGVTLPNYTFGWRTSSLRNVQVIGCVFGRMVLGRGHVVPGGIFLANHFIDTTSHGAIAPGSGVRTGDPLFRDAIGGDFGPGPGSPLVGAVPGVMAPVDLDGRRRGRPDTIGALR